MTQTSTAARPSRAARATTATAAFVAALATLLVLGSAAQAAPFTKRYGANVRGDITFAANGLVTCPTANATCGPAQNGTGAGNQLNNNGYSNTMAYIDVDGDASTDNSSSADLTIPAGATIETARLYWGGARLTGASDATLGTAKIKSGAGAYTTLNAAAGDVDTSTPNVFQASADVTALVTAGGSGTYTVGGVAVSHLRDTADQGGWTLVVAYRDTSLPRRNLSIFNGSATVNATGPTTITVDGFQTPASGPTGGKLGFVTYEGDLGTTGDHARINGTTDANALTDAATPIDNSFNSGISRFGVPTTDRNPSFINNFGYDSKLYTVSDSLIPNGSTSAFIRMDSAGDVYYPGVVTTSFLLNDVQSTKRFRNVTNPNGGVHAGDVLEYEIETTNGDGVGTAVPDAENVTLTDAVPANTDYVPGSLRVVTNPETALQGAKTDAPTDDQAEQAGGITTFRIGRGASGAAGGTLENGDVSVVRFRVTVKPGVADGAAVNNQATVSYAPLGGAPTTVTTNQVTSNGPDTIPQPAAPAITLAPPATDATKLVGTVTSPGSGPATTNPCTATIAGATPPLTVNLVGTAATGYRCEVDVPAGLTPGPHAVTVTYTDYDGRTSTANGTLTVSAPPTVTIPSPAAGTRVGVGAVRTVDFDCTTPGGPATTDPCVATVQRTGDTTITPIADGGNLPTATSGVYTITATVTDALGRTATATRTYEVFEAPTASISVPTTPVRQNSNVAGTFECNAPAGIQSCSTTIQRPDGTTGPFTSGNNLPTDQTGTYTVTTTVVDTLGQTKTVTATYLVPTPPTVVIVSPAAGSRLGVGSTSTLFDADCAAQAGVKSCVSTVTRPGGATSGIVDTDPLPTTVPGVYTLTSTVEDNVGVTRTVTRTYEVFAGPDATLTVPTGPVKQGATPTGTFACTATAGVDTCEGSVKLPDGTVVPLSNGGTLPTSQVGTYTVTVKVVDDIGQTKTITKTYVVPGPPTVAITGPDAGTRLAQGAAAPVAFGCDAPGGIDTCAASVTLPDGTNVPIKNGDPLPTQAPGVYTITATVKDQAGNEKSVTRTYEVFGPPAAAATVPSTPVTAGAKATADVGCTAPAGVASCDATIKLPDGTVVPYASGAALPTKQVGTYTVTVTVVDQLGQKASATKTYVVAAAKPDTPAAEPGELVVTKVLSAKSLRPGQVLSVKIRLRNDGGTTLRNVRVCETVPAGLKYVSSNPKASLVNGQRCWTIKRLAPGQKAAVTYKARALNRPGTVETKATGRATGVKADVARAKVRILPARTAAPAGGVTG